jgi:hypothetical protein
MTATQVDNSHHHSFGAPAQLPSRRLTARHAAEEPSEGDGSDAPDGISGYADGVMAA